jgi:hypothetical protein
MPARLIGFLNVAMVTIDMNAWAIASPLHRLLRTTHHFPHPARIIPFQFRHHFAE